MTQLQIGEHEPFRLTHDKGHRIVHALCECQATVIAAMIDTTAPATHIVMRFEMPLRMVRDFRHYVPEAGLVETVSGSSLSPKEPT